MGVRQCNTLTGEGQSGRGGGDAQNLVRVERLSTFQSENINRAVTAWGKYSLSSLSI